LLELQTRKLLQANRNQKDFSAHTMSNQNQHTLSQSHSHSYSHSHSPLSHTHTHSVLHLPLLSAAFFESWVLFYTTAALLLRFSSPFAEFIDIFSVRFVRCFLRASERALSPPGQALTLSVLSLWLPLSRSPLSTCFFVYNGTLSHTHTLAQRITFNFILLRAPVTTHYSSTLRLLAFAFRFKLVQNLKLNQCLCMLHSTPPPHTRTHAHTRSHNERPLRCERDDATR